MRVLIYVGSTLADPKKGIESNKTRQIHLVLCSTNCLLVFYYMARVKIMAGNLILGSCDLEADCMVGCLNIKQG